MTKFRHAGQIDGHVVIEQVSRMSPELDSCQVNNGHEHDDWRLMADQVKLYHHAGQQATDSAAGVPR